MSKHNKKGQSQRPSASKPSAPAATPVHHPIQDIVKNAVRQDAPDATTMNAAINAVVNAAASTTAPAANTPINTAAKAAAKAATNHVTTAPTAAAPTAAKGAPATAAKASANPVAAPKAATNAVVTAAAPGSNESFNAAACQLNDAIDIMASNFDTLLKTAETINGQITSFNNTVISQNTALSKDFFSCKTLQDLADFQAKIFQINSETLINNASTLTEALINCFQQTIDPMQKKATSARK